MTKFIENAQKKIEYIRAIPLGTTIHVESVCGGRTIKTGDPFPEKYEWKMLCMYFDYDRPPGKEYVEDLRYIIVSESDYNAAMEKKRQDEIERKEAEERALARCRRID